MASPLNLDLGFSDAFSAPQTTFAGTVFNFGEADNIGDDFGGVGVTSSATATASPAKNSAGQDSYQPQPPILPRLAIVAGLLLLGVAIYMHAK